MAPFTPTLRTIDPPAEKSVDQLGSAVLKSLLRAQSGISVGEYVMLLIGGIATAGVLPLLVLPRKFAMRAELEAEQLWHVAEWLRSEQPGATTTRFEGGFPERSFTVFKLLIFARIIGAILVALLVVLVWQHQGHLRHLPKIFWTGWLNPFRHMPFDHWFKLFFMGTTLGYFFTTAAMPLHAMRRNRSLAMIDDLLNPLLVYRNRRWYRRSIGRWLISYALIIAPIHLGIPWATFMALAIDLESSYMNEASDSLRRQLVGCVRHVLARKNPRTQIQVPRSLWPRCANENCGNRLPPDAVYCSVCGADGSEELPDKVVPA